MSTTLDSYLTERGIKDGEFAAVIGRDRSIVNKLRRGVIRPTLDVAADIETHTGGAVRMQDWNRPATSGTEAATEDCDGCIPASSRDRSDHETGNADEHSAERVAS